ncbi:MAG: hypothetical protein NTY64_01025 [Deltaproteobacteria bacterium]|nr:hypothetical protein [Deltaproteobacteria bacterium]
MAGAGGNASRLLRRKFSTFTRTGGIPADASGAYRPGPQATTKVVPGRVASIPRSLKGYRAGCCFIDKMR